ncbi:hypothetical protein Glove_262g66 [Diversispora epigaea]|uniref:Galactose oxidase n=1 Tax=Diversispora epigaea TaxID=1348612 RepID=A0A397I7G0_9GLOM|nr:hypothetical protein Glove_262g66 [Diversispora epigaea]
MHFLYNLFKFIFYIIFLINSISCYVPSERAYHNSVIIKDRLLIIGGRKNSTQSPELFYLDLSNSFDNTNLPWNLIREGDLPINTYSSTAIVSLDNSTIFLIGGYIKNKSTLDYDFSHQVYTYDYLNSKWNTPSITGDSIPTRQQMTGVIDNKGTIYIFGGFNITNFTTLAGKVYNEMNTLGTFSMSWKTLTVTSNLPPLSSDYSANILPNGIIVYIGGQANDTLVKMKNIKLFNTKKDEWLYMDAIGDDVDPRWLFASVLTPDGRIIIFGGCTLNLSSVNPKLAVLDTNKSPYEWSIPSSFQVNSPSIYGHTANLYNNHMIITFGYDMDVQMYNFRVYLYDITNNTWVTRFDPSLPSTQKSSKSLQIGLGIGISLVVLICIAIFIFCKKMKMKSQILEIADSN